VKRVNAHDNRPGCGQLLLRAADYAITTTYGDRAIATAWDVALNLQIHARTTRRQYVRC
jgi:hypothetical protein